MVARMNLLPSMPRPEPPLILRELIAVRASRLSSLLATDSLSWTRTDRYERLDRACDRSYAYSHGLLFPTSDLDKEFSE